MGTLGFLIPWNFNEYKEAITQVMSGNFTLIQRMRLAVSVHHSTASSSQPLHSTSSSSSSRTSSLLTFFHSSAFI
jgi:NAD kinase